MEFFTAKSYENAQRIGEPFLKSGKLYTEAKEKCSRCGGSGMLPYYNEGGRCFKCGGSGYKYLEIRLYTKAEKDALIRREEVSIKRKEAEAIARINENIKNSEANKQEWCRNHGFSENGKVFVIGNEDTFSIKEQLKALGCKFNRTLGWYSDREISADIALVLVPFDFDELCVWTPESKNGSFKEEAEKIVKDKLKTLKAPSLSEYYGNVGERFRDIEVTYKSSKHFDSRYGTTYVHSFYCSNDEIVWMTQKSLDLNIGELILLTATIKNHEVYNDVKITKISRALIKRKGD